MAPLGSEKHTFFFPVWARTPARAGRTDDAAVPMARRRFLRSCTGPRINFFFFFLRASPRIPCANRFIILSHDGIF
jgi:hypothetical protein